MQAVVFTKPNEYALSEVPEPLAGPGEVVVKVRSSTICATDVKIFHGHVPWVRFPHIPGHEWGGEIAAVGEGVAPLHVGDWVGVEAHVGCGGCPRCAEGLYNLCDNYGRPETGHAHIGFTVPGGLADFCAVPAKAVHRLPEGLSFDHSAFTDTVGIVLWAFERAGGVHGGEAVAIVGPGALGLLALQVARALGAGLVIVTGAEGDHDRLELARKLGADYTIDPSQSGEPVHTVRELTAGRGVDLVVEFAGSPGAARQSLEMTRRGGRVVLGGATSPGRKLEVDLSVIVRGHLDVYGSVANPRGISRRANELMQSGHVNVSPLITHHLSLTQFARAWDLFQDRHSGAIRVMLHPGG
jgi:L-iditol 2-dehydrogenase